MTIVTGVPATNLPGRYASIDNSLAVQATAATAYRMLILGTRSTGNTEPVDVVTQIFGEGDGELWGEGGMIDRSVKIARAANPSIPMFVVALAEGAGVAAVWTLTFGAGIATANSVLYLYIGGQRVTVAVEEGDDEDALAAATHAAINAATGLTVTATSASAVTTVTAKFKGVAGNSITFQFNRGLKETAPSVIGLPVVVQSVPGTLDPDITPAVAAMVGDQFTHILLPYEDAANQDIMLAELDARFGPDDQEWGISFTAMNDTTANLLIFGGTRNSQLQVTPAFDPDTASPLFEAGASFVAITVGEPDPARPLQTLVLPGVVGARTGVALRRSRAERNALLGSGIATTIVTTTGDVQIERAVTNYRLNQAGSPDISYKNLQAPLTNLVFRDAINARFAQKFPRHKLANDGAKFGDGQPIVTPKIIKAEIISVFIVFEAAGIMEGREQFIEDLIVERDNIPGGGGDPDRANYSCNPDNVNQFRILAGVIAFKL